MNATATLALRLLVTCGVLLWFFLRFDDSTLGKRANFAFLCVGLASMLGVVASFFTFVWSCC